MTVQAIIDRLYRTYLEPPNFQPARCWLTANVTTTTQGTVQIGTFAVPEDKQLLRNGIIIEVGTELMIVKGVDSVSVAAPTLTVSRGAYGTEAQVHTMPVEVKLSPIFTKQSAFEFVRDNILSCHPRLFTTDIQYLAPVAVGVYPCNDPLAISIESATPFEGTMGLDVTGEIVEYHPMTGGRAFILAGFPGAMWIRYRRRMGVATDPSDTLASLGFDSVWASVVMAGAAADLMAGKDLPSAHVDYISKLIESEAVRPGTRQSLAVGLRRYRNTLLDDFSTEMKADHKPVVKRRSPFRKVGRV